MSEITQETDTRRVFIDTLCELAQKDERIVFIVPDVGFNYAEKFQKMFPDRYFNFGVTEQSTILAAAGMALSGLKPYVYTMLNFSVFRPFEMVRNGVALHNADVKILGVKGSEKYKFLGFSHNMVFEDEDIYHLEPYMKCFKPEVGDVKEVIVDTYNSDKPVYIRL